MKLKKKIKEEINSNEGFVIMRDLWNNKRYRSIFWLILYFVFFAIIITSLRGRYQNQPQVSNKSSLDIVESLKLDEYTYEILLNEEPLINGKVENNTNVFTYKDESYVIVGDNVYLEKGSDLIKTDLIKESELIVPVNKIMLDKIGNYIENKTSEKLDKGVKYTISLSNLLEEETLDFAMYVYGDSKIERIELNLNELAQLKELEYKQYILTIKLGDETNDNNIK